jgi:hypothetical protein
LLSAVPKLTSEILKGEMKLNTDAMNKFQKADEARAAKRRQSHGVTRAEAVAARDKVREQWTSHNRPDNQTRGGLLLDSKTLAAQAEFAASRKTTESAPAQQMSAATLESITRDWLSRNPAFYNSEFNRVSMRNFLQKNINENRLTPSVEMLGVAFEWLTKNNHLEKPLGAPRKRGEVVSGAAPTLFRYTPPEEVAAQEEERLANRIEARKREDAANKNLSLAELREKARHERGVLSRLQASEVHY